MYTDSRDPVGSAGQETVDAIEQVGDAWAALMQSLGLLSRSVDALAELPDPDKHAAA